MIIINRLFSGAILVLYTTVLSIFAGPTVPTEAQIKLSHGDRRIGTYVSSEKGFGTSSYWIEGPTGLIFIDTQFLLSAGLEALNWAEQITGKKTQLAIILHPNPDKFNGTLIYKKRGIRVVTSKQVQELIPEVHKDRTHWFYERFKPDYPNELPLPDSFGNSRQSLNAGGVTVTAHVLGMGCSAAHVVVQFENHVFVGDLVSNGNHSWIELGRLEEWLKRLDEISAMNPSFVHPGRGPAGGAELLEREEDYLKSILKIVRQSGLQKKSSEKLMNRLQEQIENKYPGYGYSYFLEIGLPAVWAYETKVSSRSSRVK